MQVFRPPLTDKQARTLALLEALQATGLPPTVSELAAAAGVGRTAMHYRLHVLIAKGYLIHDPRKARSFRPLREGS